MTTPLDIALIGCGRRAQQTYFQVLPALAEGVRVVAVCDPVPGNRTVAAAHFGAPAFDSLRALLRAKPMAAALVATPPSSHHAVSCLLSAHGVHHLVETPMCDTLAQAHAMVAQAERHGVVFRVAEQFWRDPIDLLARQLIQAGVIGAVHRITHFQAHLGYHNNSRHQMMVGAAPLAVNAVEQGMPTVHYINTERHHRDETFRNRSFHFPNGVLVTDLAGNIKGALGRYDRPGLMEIDGTHGAIVQEAVGHWSGRAEVRIVPEPRLTDGSGGYSESHPILYRYRDADGEIEERALFERADELVYLGAHVELPQGRFEVENEFAPRGVATPGQAAFAGVVRDFAELIEARAARHDCMDAGGSATQGAVAEGSHGSGFANLVHAGRPGPFTPAMAVMSLTMELAAALSARRDGARVELSDPGIALLDAERQAALRVQFGFDPLDIETVAYYAFPKP
jgi:predicted dehydrogenase